MSTTSIAVTEIAPIGHDEAMAIAAVEYERTLDLLRSLDPDQWYERVPDCPAWDIRQLVCHHIGAAESYAGMLEGIRQMRAAGKTAKRRGVEWIDAWTANQVEPREHLSPDELLAETERAFEKALRGRTKVPGLVRRVPMKFPEPIGRRLPMGYLLDTIANRDLWMHRVDVSQVIDREMVLTPDHDGRVVADVVREWAELHGQPFDLRLTGPAGGAFVSGEGGESIEIDAVEFCRILSGRGEGEGLLGQAVPF